MVIKINNILLIYIWCILSNLISYTEELLLSMIYIVLFIIISVNSKEAIKTMIVTQTFKIMFCYEQLIYLKKQVIIKSLKFKKIILQQKFIQSMLNKGNFDIKKKNKHNVEFKNKINNIRNLYYLLFLLVSKL